MLERDAGVPLDDLVERFAELRTANLAALGDLVTDADLDRSGMHPTLGEVTLRELLATWAVHDLDHIAQIYAALTYYHDHKEQIDREIEEGERLAEELRPLLENPQLRAKLQEAKRRAAGRSA